LERVRLNEARSADEIAFKAAQAASDKGYDTAQDAYRTSYAGATAASNAGFDTALTDANRGFDTALTDANRGFDAAQFATELGYTTAEDDFKRAYQRQGEFQKPFIDDGRLAQDQIMQLMGLSGDKNAANYGEYAKTFGAEEFALDPGYAFRNRKV
jgi:hypothetical protein